MFQKYSYSGHFLFTHHYDYDITRNTNSSANQGHLYATNSRAMHDLPLPPISRCVTLELIGAKEVPLSNNLEADLLTSEPRAIFGPVVGLGVLAWSWQASACGWHVRREGLACRC
jgi:hypothetical protein